MSARFLFVAAVPLFAPAAVPNTPAGPGAADFRYSPPWWQSTISLPDDPDKILVGKEGQILFDFQKGKGGPRGFGLWVQPGIASGARWKRQETLSGRVPIVRTWMDADGVEVIEETFVATQLTSRKPARIVLHLDGLAGENKTVELPRRESIDRTIKLNDGRLDPGRIPPAPLSRDHEGAVGRVIS